MTEAGRENGFQPVKSADRTLEILEVLAASSQRRTLGDLARQLSIPKSSLHGILRTMVERGWVETDDTGARFSLGMRALRVGASYVDRDDGVSRVQPVLDWLAQQTGETTHLGRLDGCDVVYLAKRESAHPLRLYSAIGRRLPAHATALGKSLLATHTPSQLAKLLPGQLTALTAHTITDHVALHRELEEIRQNGYAIDHEENSDGIRCYAVALTEPYSGPATDAISISIPTFRLTDDIEQNTIALLLDANRRLDNPSRTVGPG